MSPFLFAATIGLLVAVQASAATVSVPEDVAPWGLNPELAPGEQGIYADLATALSAAAQIPIVIKFVPYGHMLQGVRSGEFDYAFGVVSPATAEAGPFDTIVGKVPMIAVARKGLPLRSLSDLHAFAEVGYLRGGSCGAILDADPAIHRVSQDSYVAAIRKLVAGRLDGWCSIEAGFKYALRPLNVADQLGEAIEYGQVQIGFQTTPGKVGTEEAKRLNAALANLVRDGAAGQIFIHYLGAPYPP